MLADVLAGRRSENDYISGYFLKVSARYEIPTPHNRALFDGIRLLDEQIQT
jgi:ketopantoate reductase